MEYNAIAVIDLSNRTLNIYDLPKGISDSEEIEDYLREFHHLSNCSWGQFDGEINDNRN